MKHIPPPYPNALPLSPKPYDEMPYAGDGQGYRVGDWMFYRHAENSPCEDWDNCVGHLYVVLPCGCLFDCSRRASNCGSKSERTHRCWVIEGTLPNVSLTKTGHTCTAGAGSIGHPHWHGFLRNGVLGP